MTIQAIYSSPTTPSGPGWSVDVASDIRLGSIDGISTEAELGATGEGNNVVDDPDGTAGHLSDGFVGLKQWALVETACPAGNQRMWTGYTADRTYLRGTTEPSGTPSSLITTVARKIDISLVDLNWFLSFRVFAPTADDPTSDFVRPAETDLERVQALLTTVDFLSTTLFDIGYIPTTGGVAMDANDYTGMRPIDVLNDCAQVSGRNFFVVYDETGGQYVLWYDNWKTDGASTLAFDSPLQLSNVLSEVDDTTTFAATAKGKLDPSRLISGIRGTGTGVTGYQTNPTTANTYAWRDGAPLNPSVKTQAKLDALLLRYLSDNSTEDNRISSTVRLPAAYVTGIKAGQRIQVHFTHCPGVQAGFTWCRILQMTIRQDQQTDAYYWLDLELSPIPQVCSAMGLNIDTFAYDVPLGPTASGFRYYLSHYGSSGDYVASDPEGLTFYMLSDPHYRPAPGAGACGPGAECGGGLYYRNYGFAAPAMPTGFADTGALLSPKYKVFVVGPGTLTLWFTDGDSPPDGYVELWSVATPTPSDPGDDITTLVSTATVVKPSVTISVPDDGICLHFALVHDQGFNQATIAFGGWDWVAG